jgi:poly-beta-1,6-N-acetyl-D-glucosamine synthase
VGITAVRAADATPSLRYAVITPVRNEAENLRRLAGCLTGQDVPPLEWLLVDTGSTDETVSIARSLAEEHPFVRLQYAPAELAQSQRGAPIVRAFELGLAVVDEGANIVVKLDADVSFERDYFSRLLTAFERDPSLGIASGGAEEFDGANWTLRLNTAGSVWGAARAYRRECLTQVTPLEQSMGWDGIDEARAQLNGWTTRTFSDLRFRHHRLEGQRDGSRWRAWAARGRASHFMGYRWWYLVLRSLHHTRREFAALALIWGYAGARIRRERVCSDVAVRSHVRRTQSVRTLLDRRREALEGSD